MIEPIVIKVVDKVPIVVSGPQYVVCDNSDYTVVWQLDEEWAQFESRTMQVNYKDGTYERVLFTGNSCTLPAIPVKDWFCVGLFAGDIHTTRPARLLAVRSAQTDSGEERDPMPNGYAQAIEALDGKLDKNQGTDNAGKALVIGDDGNVVPGEVQGGGAVRYDVAQNLDGNEQRQARKNIDAFPGTKLQYFFDTTAGSKHDNDIFVAEVYDVIRPGNTYSDGTHSNAGMEFPAYVMSSRNLAQGYYEMRLLDNNGAVWNVVINKSSKALHDCSKISGKQVMCVNFTQGTDGNWSADKKWDEAAALIEAGGYVYAMFDGISFPLVDYSDNDFISFMILMTSPLDIRNNAFRWNQDGTIEAVLDALLPVVMYVEQELTADQQAQARKNIGLTPVAKTDEMTQSVGLDAETGGLYTKPGPGAWYVTVTQTSSDSVVATADKTPQEIVAAYQAGYSIYANIVVKPDAKSTESAMAPIVFGDLDSFTVVFSTVRSMRFLTEGAVAFYAMFVDGGWRVNLFELAKTADIPVASPTQLGVVKPVAKTDAMTRGVGVDSNGGLYTEPDSVYYIDLEGTFPNFTTSKTNAEIHSAYQSGRTLVCRFYQDDNRWTLPLLSPTLGLWLFGAVISTGKPVGVDAAQGIAAIVGNGQGIVTQVDLATKADIPAALPNPNALTIKVGDTTTTYDGSAAKTVEVEGGNNPLDITGAQVGQIAKITAVDADGKPTAWKAVDMPSGGSDEWELIQEVTIADGAEESNHLTINADKSGNPFSLKRAKIYGYFPVYTGESTIPTFSFFMLNGISSGDNASYCYTSGWVTPLKNANSFCSVDIDLTISGLQSESVSRSRGTSGIEYFGSSRINSITSIGGTNMLIYPGCRFELYGVRA